MKKFGSKSMQLFGWSINDYQRNPTDQLYIDLYLENCVYHEEDNCKIEAIWINKK